MDQLIPFNIDIDKIGNNLYISDVFTSQNLGVLIDRKITHILTMADQIEPKYLKNFTYKCIKILDIDLEADIK
jgi:hypothetical protein